MNDFAFWVNEARAKLRECDLARLVWAMQQVMCRVEIEGYQIPADLKPYISIKRL